MAGYFSTCNECGAHGVMLTSVPKHGGGSYRRAGRTYRGSVCQFCIREMMALIAHTESENRHVGALVWQYSTTSIRNHAAKMAEQRALVGDFATGAKEAEFYWSDYKRMTALMEDRLEDETAEYRDGFNSVAH